MERNTATAKPIRAWITALIKLPFRLAFLALWCILAATFSERDGE
jgi:hypothetical protein